MKLDSKIFDSIRVKPDEDRLVRDANPPCEWPGCDGAGVHRAPKGRGRDGEYHLFCMDHVRAYNARWNFYAGLSQDEIEKQIRADTTWWRPTWPLGAGGKRRRASLADESIVDFGAFAQDDWDHEQTRPDYRNGNGWRPRPGSNEADALVTLDLHAPVTRDDIKVRYKELVKKYHPDANGGNRDAEERLKVINRAYSVLRSCSDL